MVNSISVRSVGYFVVVIVFVATTFFMMQGLLPLSSDATLHVENDPDKRLRDINIGPIDKKVDNQLSSVTRKDVLRKTMDFVDVSKVDLLAKEIPEKIKNDAAKVVVKDHKVQIMGVNMFYREASPPDGVSPSTQSALLLHGMSFKSQTWLQLNTINLLASMGHRVIAVDLPGYGETGGDQLQPDKKADYLNEIIESLHLEMPVVVSPSMSGTFSLPHLFKYPEKTGGYVPVAPVTTERFTKEQYGTVKTPTMIVYGELDAQLGDTSTSNLRNIPNSQIQKLPKAKHPAYLDQPELWHKLLYNFFLVLQKK